MEINTFPMRLFEKQQQEYSIMDEFNYLLLVLNDG